MRALLVVLLLSGCATTPHRRPLAGPAHPPRGELGYFIYTDEAWLVVRLHTNEKSHRFQGSITPARGQLRELTLERPALADEVAMQDGSVQFDVEVGKNAEQSFRVRLPHASEGGCAKFDLYVDGTHRPERVYLGAKMRSPEDVPFERCR